MTTANAIRMPTLVGFGGRMRSGKDMLAEYLVAKHGFKRIALADALKEEVKKVLPKTLAVEATRFYGHKISAGEMTLREAVNTILYRDKTDLTRAILQEWGTDLRRAENQHYWTTKFVQAYLKRAGVPVVCPDVRFKNEIEMIKVWKGLSIWVERATERSDFELDHPSEQELTMHSRDWDVIIKNNGTKEYAYEQLEAFLQDSETQQKIRKAWAWTKHS